jgi:uncharacterized protein (TIGR00730 family)
MTISVFASSSSLTDKIYSRDASNLGTLLAKSGISVVYGGGAVGLMGKLADAILSNNGTIIGVIPSFMIDEGWNHKSVEKMIITADMGERKKMMFSMSDAVIALPGGIGTLEELTEAITLKQLGLFSGPVIIINTMNYYRCLIDFLDHMIAGNFLRNEHKAIWEIVNTPEEALSSLFKNEHWSENPRSIAQI